MTYEQTASHPIPDDELSDPGDENVVEYVEDDEEWVSAAPKGLRVRVPTGVLLLLLFAAIGLWSGSILQKRHDKSTAATRTATAAATAGLGGAARRAAGQTGAGTGTGATGATGAPGGAGGTGLRGGTAGIVSDIQGSTIYLTDTSGNLIKITTTPASTIRKTATGTMADIKLGETLIVTGAKAADGSTAARSITISPGGLGGGAGGFGGAAAAGGGAPAAGGGG
jgi:hypothetical protein